MRLITGYTSKFDTYITEDGHVFVVRVLPRSTAYHGEVVTVQGKTLLTGSQWYDRFEKELNKVKFKGVLDKQDFIEGSLRLAKKAAGIES